MKLDRFDKGYIAGCSIMIACKAYELNCWSVVGVCIAIFIYLAIKDASEVQS